MGDERRPILDAKALVPLGVIVTASVMLITVYAWLSAQFSDLKMEINKIGYRLDRVEERTSEKTADRYTATDHELWAAEFARLNPALNVPKLARTGLTVIK